MPAPRLPCVLRQPGPVPGRRGPRPAAAPGRAGCTGPPPGRTAQRRGVPGGAPLPGAAAPGLLRPCACPLQPRLVQGGRDEPPAAMAQRAAPAGRRRRAAAVQHPLPALVQHGARHRVLSADVAGSLHQRGQRQDPSVAWRCAPRLRARARGQRRRQVRVEALRPYGAQKDQALPRLLCARGTLLLFRGQRDRRVPPDRLLTVAGARCSSTPQIT